MRWVVVVAVKTPARSNTRLSAAARSTEELVTLTLAMRADTEAAIRGAELVDELVVVTDAPGVAAAEHLVVQTTAGLNQALAEGAAYAARRWPAHAVAALVGDLPALTSADLDAALSLASAHPHAFVADAHGTGTTMLTAGAGETLRPRFGTGSAQRHGEFAAILPAAPGLRTDVDSPGDLGAAAAIGVGRHTAAMLPHMPFTSTGHHELL